MCRERLIRPTKSIRRLRPDKRCASGIIALTLLLRINSQRILQNFHCRIELRNRDGMALLGGAYLWYLIRRYRKVPCMMATERR